MSSEPEYRYHGGHIEVRFGPSDEWVWSAHDTTYVEELDGYEQTGHPATSALREKFTKRGELNPHIKRRKATS